MLCDALNSWIDGVEIDASLPNGAHGLGSNNFRYGSYARPCFKGDIEPGHGFYS